MQRHIAYLDIFKHQRCAIANVFSVTEGFCLQWVPVRPQLLVGGPCHAAAFGDPGGKRQVLPLPLSCIQAGWPKWPQMQVTVAAGCQHGRRPGRRGLRCNAGYYRSISMAGNHLSACRAKQAGSKACHALHGDQALLRPLTWIVIHDIPPMSQGTSAVQPASGGEPSPCFSRVCVLQADETAAWKTVWACCPSSYLHSNS